MEQQMIAEVVVWPDGKDDPTEQADRIVTLNCDAVAETGRIEFNIPTRKGTVYFRVDPEDVLLALHRLFREA